MRKIGQRIPLLATLLGSDHHPCEQRQELRRIPLGHPPRPLLPHHRPRRPSLLQCEVSIRRDPPRLERQQRQPLVRQEFLRARPP